MASLGGGLQRGSNDFNIILHRFKKKEYKSYSYDSELIRKSNPEWERKYEKRAFAESIRNILAVLALVPPLKVSTSDPLGNTDIGPETMDIDDGAVPPGADDVPSGIEMLQGERLLCTPKHVVAWTDSTRNQNNRITIYMLLPPGHARKHYTIRVDSFDVVMTYTWPEEMLNAFILTKGHNMYEPGKSRLRLIILKA